MFAVVLPKKRFKHPTKEKARLGVSFSFYVRLLLAKGFVAGRF
jgi:hypothetical protein